MRSADVCFSGLVKGRVFRIICPNSPYPKHGAPEKLLASIARWFGTPVSVCTIWLSCSPNVGAIESALESIAIEQNWPDQPDVLGFVLECSIETWIHFSSYQCECGNVLETMRSSLWRRDGDCVKPG